MFAATIGKTFTLVVSVPEKCQLTCHVVPPVGDLKCKLYSGSEVDICIILAFR